jgi:hypothetical protein
VRILFGWPLRYPALVAPTFLAGALWYSAAAVSSVSAQTVPCDPSLEQARTHPYGYRVRGDRCEGIYAQPVAGTPLVIASFTERFEAYDPDTTRSLVLQWSAPGAGHVRLRALALPRRTYYRMDTEQGGSDSSWTWPADLLAALDIGRPELGVVAWTRQAVGDTERDVHLPLRIGAAQTTDAAGGYTLIVVPQVELTEMYVTVAAIGGDGRAAAYLRDEEPLGYGYYPTDRPIEITIARPATPGLYRVQIGAGIRGGGSLATELWFLRSPD